MLYVMYIIVCKYYNKYKEAIVDYNKVCINITYNPIWLKKDCVV